MKGLGILIMTGIFLSSSMARADIASDTTVLKVYEESKVRVEQDWLVHPAAKPVDVYRSADGKEIVLSNGLISRTFRIAPNAATISYRNLRTGAEFIRSVRPEVLMTVDGQEVKVGGLLGQPVHNYLDRAWIEKMTDDPKSLAFAGFDTAAVTRVLPWKPRYGAPETPWPPKGKQLTLHFKSREKEGLQVSVQYEMYEGIPLLCKRVVVRNTGGAEIVLEKMATEILAVPHDQASHIWVESDYTFARMETTRWEDDPLYTTYSEGQKSFEALRYVPNFTLDEPWKVTPREYTGLGGSRYLLLSKYSQGLAKSLKPGEEFTSFRTYEILHDSDDLERQGLARRKMFRTVAPWTQENPIFMHERNSDSESIRRAVDQCVETGFEMIIVTFWSGFNMESADRAYWERIKADFDYAHSKGIRIGGYVLFCTTASKGPKYDAIENGSPAGSLCLGSEYVDGYFKHLYDFMEFVGQDIIETDGPYHGYPCEATNHKYHKGRDDSFRVQWEKQAEFFNWCRRRGVFVNAPDDYFHHGSNKTGMGYVETNWSLPREYQILIARQNIFDGTWRKLSSMGWMLTPLVEYHGGGAAATLEPLKDHLEAYGAHLAQNFGSGVQSCYRGPRLYDADETRILVKDTVTWYKKHRAILESDIIHVRRPSGRDVDCMLHANPALKEKGLAMVYNPLSEKAKRTLTLPLYYTGITGSAMIREKEGLGREYKLARDYSVEVPVEVPPHGYTWLVIESGERP